jgi:rod shape-determining protein MreB and related proteins
MEAVQRAGQSGEVPNTRQVGVRDRSLAEETGLSVTVADDALRCVALGAGMTLEDSMYRGALIAA